MTHIDSITYCFKQKKTSFNDVVNYIITAFIIIQVIFLPVFTTDEFMFGAISGKTSVFLISILIMFFLILIKFLYKKSSTLAICNVDIFLIITVCYVFINCIIKDGAVTNRVLELLGLCFLYLSLRVIKHKQFILILTAIIFSCIIQCIYGNFQLWGILKSQHNQFSLTGGFFNPGPYAGYLASSFPIILGLYFAKDLKIKENVLSENSNALRSMSLLAIILIFITLPVTESRAAWFSVICTSIIIFSYRFSLVTKFKRINRLKIKWLLLFVIIIIILIMSCFSMYKYKVDSANGRLLIWKATLGMIEKNPISGVGFDRFKSFYMNEQAEYFAQNPQSSSIAVAGDVEYCFNEPLQFIAENGLIGLILISVSAFHLIKIPSNGLNRHLIFILKTGLFGILIFGLFSYPSQILPIKVNAVCYMGLLAFFDLKRWTIEFKINNILKCTVLFFSILVFSLSFKYISSYIEAWKNWNKAYQFYSIDDYDKSLEYYSKTNFILARNGDFLTNYGKTLVVSTQYDTAILVLSDATKEYPNIVAFTAIGDSYKATKRYVLAEQAYLTAYRMNPNRFYTRYLLAKLYDETNQYEKAINIAYGLLNEKPKVESTAVNEIKEEMRNILNKK
ncbi:MAG: O-antigen ligase family protein [Dysgonomonas mossii]|nr:O-antigen ligase family protein [Dysgonomonas mossii]